ncbi:MAG TPA: SUMF1/EgtB/PvdO family nonheme iron enzyme [Candidatus Cloacimonadota bacterium]|nr:SUMF1/EgtB/PvdO family nonheme iron enzyme [Candidatus Cloacimonadota bacterium]
MKKLLLLSLLLLLITSMPAARKALLIGNAAYSSRTLRNPVNDASDLEAALKELGFATTLIKDADYRDMYKGIESFTDGLVYGDEAIFYFSGHGVQIADNNYLIPIGDRKLTDKIDFDTFAISATWTLGKLAKARVSVMILDACRDNPTVSRSVAGKKGLAKLEPESGSQYVIYATEKDTEASDGEGRNSPFAQSLLRHIKSPVSVGEELMRLIRSDVKKATNNQQIPTAYGMLDEPYYLVAPASQPTERVVQTPSQTQDSKPDSRASLAPSGMIYMEGGSFMMGSEEGEEDEKPVHEVTISSYLIGKKEVTQKEWLEVMGTKPSSFKGDDLPVINVSWFDAIEFCNKLSLKEGLNPSYTGSGSNVTCNWISDGYRLPTEAEWEFAARGGSHKSEYMFSGSNDVTVVAWYKGNASDRIQNTGSKASNALGLLDMSGNVWEWCWDRYDKKFYHKKSYNNPRGANKGSTRVLRGGSWFSEMVDCRVTKRLAYSPVNKYNNVGFRIVRSDK